MRNLTTKEDRTKSRNTQFEYLLREGYSRETYKALDIFTNFQHGKYYLKVFRGTAANHEAYFCYRTEEQRSEAVQRYKSSFDRTETYKAEAKIRNKGKSSSHAAASAAIKAELTAADRLQEVSDALQAAQEAQENKEPEAAQTTPELPETAIIPTPPHVQIVQDMNHIMSHFDPRHPVNICDPKSSQYREVIKELNEQPKHYDNLQDITEAAESGQVISLFNLSQLV